MHGLVFSKIHHRPRKIALQHTNRGILRGGKGHGGGLGRRLDNGTGFPIPTTPNYGRTRLDDAGLFGCDLLDGIPQKFGVIQGNARDDRRQGILNHIGGVKASTQPRFEHYDITTHLFEITKSDRGDQLKFGGRILHLIGKGTHLGRDLGQRRIVDRLAAKGYALVKGFDVR